MSSVFGLWHYWVVIALAMTGLLTVIARHNLIKKVIGLNILQSAVILLYVSMGNVKGGTAPILVDGGKDVVYSNPLPHVLMLTAIVVAVATLGVALALAIKVYNRHQTLEEDEILAQIREK